MAIFLWDIFPYVQTNTTKPLNILHYTKIYYTILNYSILLKYYKYYLSVITTKLLNAFTSSFLTLCRIYFYTFFENFFCYSSSDMEFRFPSCHLLSMPSFSKIFKNLNKSFLKLKIQIYFCDIRRLLSQFRFWWCFILFTHCDVTY